MSEQPTYDHSSWDPLDSQENYVQALQLPISDRRVLQTGDWDVTLTTKSGKNDFLIGVDKDGTPTASSGYVQRAP